jgi:hypothetical protein
MHRRSQSLNNSERCAKATNSKAASVPTPDGFAFHPRTRRVLERHALSDQPVNDVRLAFTWRPHLPFKARDAS